MRIGFVFTNYNNAGLTMAAIESLASSEGWNDSWVAVVDNRSEYTDRMRLAEIQEMHPRVQVVYNQENLGYFKGLNVGIRLLRADYEDLECVVIGNNDLVFNPDFHSQVVECRQVITEHAVVAPDIVSLDGFHQNPHVVSESCISAGRRLIWRLYYRNYQVALFIRFISKLLRTHSFSRVTDPNHYRTPRIIHQGYGACYLLGPRFFATYDELWAPTFLMEEELFLALQLQDKGLDCYFEPRIVVYHRDHATLDTVPTRTMWEISRDSHTVAMTELARRRKK